MKINVEKATYIYKKPVPFLGTEYSDSLALLKVFLENWDMAAASFRCGNWLGFWKEYVQTAAFLMDKNDREFKNIYDRMWRLGEHINEDVLFSKVVHLIEPAMEEIPCFINSADMVELWNTEDFRDYIQKRSGGPFMLAHVDTHFATEWDEEYTNYDEGIAYLCQMQREQVFSCWGYTRAEAKFMKFVENPLGVKSAAKEELAKAFSNLADQFYSRTCYVYHDKNCEKLADFTDIWMQEINTWSLGTWDEFIEELFEERKGSMSFLHWLDQLQEPQLVYKLKNWKILWDKIEKFPKTIMWLEMVFFSDYVKWGSQSEANKRLKEIEKKVEQLPAWIKKNSGLEKVERFVSLYQDFYAIFQEKIPNCSYAWENLFLKEEFDTVRNKWEAWENRMQKNYADAKKLAEALRSHNVLECWNGEFTYDKQKLALLACAPVKESYQQDCKAFLALAEAGGEGFSQEEIKTYITDIYNQIFLKLFEKDVPAATIDFYFELLGELSGKLGGSKNLEFLADRSGLAKAILDWLDCESITEYNRYFVTEEDIQRLQKQVKKLAVARNNVDYASFNQHEVFKTWQKAQSDLAAIERVWFNQSEDIKKKYDEIVSYVDAHCHIQKLSQIKAVTSPMQNALERELDDIKKKQTIWQEQLAVTNAQCEAVMKARREYENEWDKKQEAKKAAEKQKQLQVAKAKKLFKRCRILLIVIAVIFGGAYGFIVYKVKKDGLTHKNLKLTFADLSDMVDDEGVLEFPDRLLGVSYNKIGSWCYLPEGTKRIEVPETVTTLNYSFAEEGRLEEADLPGVTTIEDHAFYSCWDLREVNAPEATIIGEYAFFYCESITEISLPKATTLMWGAFGGAYGLTIADLPEVTTVGEAAFGACSSLTVINLPKAETIGKSAFHDCDNLTVVSLPKAKTVSKLAFSDCPNLNVLYLPSIEYIDLTSEMTGKVYLGDTLQSFDYNANAETPIHIVLDSNGEYSNDAINKLISAENYGAITVSYEDFSSLDIDALVAEKRQKVEEQQRLEEQGIYSWNDHYYAFYDNCGSWEEAETYCREQGGHLATITSAEENSALYSFLQEKGVADAYFGLNDSANEGSWVWTNGESVSYINWHTGEPNAESSTEDYGMFYSKFNEGTWNDGPFSSGAWYICEWDSMPEIQ